MAKDEAQDKEFPSDEIARRRDAALLRALSTPHKKQTDMKLGKTAKASRKPKAGRKKRDS